MALKFVLSYVDTATVVDKIVLPLSLVLFDVGIAVKAAALLTYILPRLVLLGREILSGRANYQGGWYFPTVQITGEVWYFLTEEIASEVGTF